jgi:hypothetical protein
MPGRRQLRLVTAIGRRIDRSVCDGAIANAARSVHADRTRADQRREAWRAVQPRSASEAEQDRPGDPVVQTALVAVPDQRRHSQAQ